MAGYAETLERIAQEAAERTRRLQEEAARRADPLGLGDLPQQEPAQGGYGTPVRTPVQPVPKAVEPYQYEDRNSYYQAKQQVNKQRAALAQVQQPIRRVSRWAQYDEVRVDDYVDQARRELLAGPRSGAIQQREITNRAYELAAEEATRRSQEGIPGVRLFEATEDSPYAPFFAKVPVIPQINRAVRQAGRTVGEATGIPGAGAAGEFAAGVAHIPENWAEAALFVDTLLVGGVLGNQADTLLARSGRYVGPPRLAGERLGLADPFEGAAVVSRGARAVAPYGAAQSRQITFNRVPSPSELQPLLNAGYSRFKIQDRAFVWNEAEKRLVPDPQAAFTDHFRAVADDIIRTARVKGISPKQEAFNRLSAFLGSESGATNIIRAAGGDVARAGEALSSSPIANSPEGLAAAAIAGASGRALAAFAQPRAPRAPRATPSTLADIGIKVDADPALNELPQGEALKNILMELNPPEYVDELLAPESTKNGPGSIMAPTGQPDKAIYSSYEPAAAHSDDWGVNATFNIGQHTVHLSHRQYGTTLSWSRREWDIRRALGEPINWGRTGMSFSPKDLRPVLEFVHDLLKENPDAKFVIHPADERLARAYKNLFASVDRDGEYFIDRKKVDHLISRLLRGQVSGQLKLDMDAAQEAMSRPYKNAPQDVVEKHAAQGVRAAKEELKLREEGDTEVYNPDEPTRAASASEAAKMLAEVEDAMPIISQKKGAHPTRVFGHNFPPDFVQTVAGREYIREIVDALSPLADAYWEAARRMGDMNAKLESGRFGGIALTPGNLAENHRTFRNLYEQLTKSKKATHKEWAERLSYINPYGIERELRALFGPYASIDDVVGFYVQNLGHEFAHNWALARGADSHGKEFNALKDRLMALTMQAQQEAIATLGPILKRAYERTELEDDYGNWERHAHRQGQAGSGSYGAEPDLPLAAERSTASPGSGGEPDGLVAEDGGSPPQAPVPGGATPAGGNPPADPVDTLLQAKTTEDLEQASFLRKTVERLRSAREWMTPDQRTARALQKATDKRVLEKGRNVVVRYAGQIHQAIPREIGIEVRELRREMGPAKQEQLRAITGALDDFDAATRQRFLDKLTTPEQLAAYMVMRKRIDAMGDLLVARGIISEESRVENYFTHILDFIDEGQRTGLSAGGGMRTPKKRPRDAVITGRRTKQTVVDDIVEGYRPVTLDPFKIYEQFLVEANTRLAMADIIDDIRKFDPEGVKFLKGGENPPEGFKTVRHPMFEGLVVIDRDGKSQIIRYRWAVRENVARYIQALAQPSLLRDNKITKAMLVGTASVKRTVLGGPLDINMAGFELKAGGYLLGSDVRKSALAGVHAAMMGDESFDRWMQQDVQYAGRTMSRLELYRRLDEAGTTASSYRTEISRMLGDEQVTTIPGLIPIVGKWYENAQTWVENKQFDRLIPILKHESAAVLVEKKLRTSRGKNMSLEEVEREAANDVNQAFGGLNRVAQGRSQTAQDIAALLAIAPDWLESRLALGFGALLPGARTASNRRFYARVLIAGAVMTIIGSYAYAKERGWDDEQTMKYIGQNLNPIRMQDGKVKINGHFMEYQLPGTGQWSSLLSWEKDLWRVIFGLGALAMGDREGFDLTAGGYITGRQGVLPRYAIDAIYMKNYSGQNITEKKGWPAVADWLKYEATQTFVPSFASGVLQSQVEGYPGGKQSLLGAIQNASGMGRARTISASDTIDRLVQDEHIQKSDGSGEYLHYRDLPPDIKGEFDKRHPEAAAEVVKAREERNRDTFDILRRQTQEGLAGLAPLAQQDREAYRLQVADFVSKRAAITQSVLEELKREGVSFSDRDGDLGLLDDYFAAVAPATDPKTLVTDFDKRDELEDAYRAGLNETQRKRLDEMLVYTTDPTYQELKLDKAKIADSGYFDRADKSFEDFKKHFDSLPSLRETAKTWQTPDDFKKWVKDDLRRRGIAPEMFDRHDYWKAWADELDEDTGSLLAKNPELDYLLIKWGYQRRVHSQAAAELYQEETGLYPPVPAN